MTQESVTGQVRAWSARSAAVAFAMDHLDQLAPGWTFTVFEHTTGKTYTFELNEDGDVVPVVLFPMM